jgi:hypothetical protein
VMGGSVIGGGILGHLQHWHFFQIEGG